MGIDTGIEKSKDENLRMKNLVSEIVFREILAKNILLNSTSP